MIFNSTSSRNQRFNQEPYQTQFQYHQTQRKRQQPKAKLVKPNTLLDQKYFESSKLYENIHISSEIKSRISQYQTQSSYKNNPYPNFDYGYIPAHNRKIGQSKYSYKSNQNYRDYKKYPQFKKRQYFRQHQYFSINQALKNAYEKHKLQDSITFLKHTEQNFKEQNEVGSKKKREATYQNVCLNPILAESLNYSHLVVQLSDKKHSKETSRFSNEGKVFDKNKSQIGNYYQISSNLNKTSSQNNSLLEREQSIPKTCKSPSFHYHMKSSAKKQSYKEIPQPTKIKTNTTIFTTIIVIFIVILALLLVVAQLII